MPISVICPSCQSKLHAPEKAAGSKLKCPKCKAAVLVPILSAVQAPTAASFALEALAREEAGPQLRPDLIRLDAPSVQRDPGEHSPASHSPLVTPLATGWRERWRVWCLSHPQTAALLFLATMAFIGIVTCSGVSAVLHPSRNGSSNNNTSRSHSSVKNAQSFTLEWLRDVTEDNGIEVLEIKPILMHLEKGGERLLAPLFSAWGGRGEVWRVSGRARSMKRGWVYIFEMYARCCSDKSGEEWETMIFDWGEPLGKSPAIYPERRP
jgi:hypothetical protein